MTSTESRRVRSPLPPNTQAKRTGTSSKKRAWTSAADLESAVLGGPASVAASFSTWKRLPAARTRIGVRMAEEPDTDS